jgi:hypothetical protein
VFGSSSARRIAEKVDLAEAHGSISVQERQPNLTFSRFGLLTRLNAGSGSCCFRKHIKRLAEGGDDFAILLGRPIVIAAHRSSPHEVERVPDRNE